MPVVKIVVQFPKYYPFSLYGQVPGAQLTYTQPPTAYFTLDCKNKTLNPRKMHGLESVEKIYDKFAEYLLESDEGRCVARCLFQLNLTKLKAISLNWNSRADNTEDTYLRSNITSSFTAQNRK